MKNKRLLYILIVLALLAVSAVVYFTVDAILDRTGAQNDDAKPTQMRFNILDEPIKSVDITFTDMEGNRFNLKEFEGRNVIINFWAVFCGPCVTELPDFDKAVAEFEAMDTVLLAINVVEPKDEVQDFIDNIKLSNLGFYMDVEGNAAYTYSVSTIPRTLVIDKEGYIIAAATGSVTYEDLMALAEILD
ncbi:MAG TPA: redoxin domain-containing protein [Clostridia bacterium]|nr:redoxin domain-containing protein [Clostridia bacterium]HPQ46300.1 redoxin domain-containing protein [Clostridia bacterium]